MAGGDKRPAGVVYPSSTAQVQAMVRLANQYKTPLYPVSTGHNIGLGSRSAPREGQVVVDLGFKMNRILEIDEKLAFAVVEPGVSYQNLYDELVRRGNKLMLDVTSGPPQGGMIGNALDKGAGYTPYFDHFGFSCGLEIVLGNGELLRTGDGALEFRDARQLAHVEIFLRPDPRRPVRAVELRHRHAHGRLAAAEAAGGALLPLRVSRRRRSRTDRRTVPADEAVEFRADAVSGGERSLSLRLGRRERRNMRPPRARSRSATRAARRLQKKHGLGAWNVSGAFYGPSMAALDPMIQRVRRSFRPEREGELHPARGGGGKFRRCRSRSTPFPAFRASANSAC